jgi:large subunit ribosomal protein L24
MASTQPIWSYRKPYRRIKIAKQPLEKWRIFKGDLVQVIYGKDVGKQGKVKRVDRKRNFVWVEGLNLVKKSVKDDEQRKGAFYSVEAPIFHSNVMLVDPTSGKPTKVRYSWDENGTKIRVSKLSGSVIPKPIPDDYLRVRQLKLSSEPGPKDTPQEAVWKRTYFPPSLEELD